MYMFKFSNKYRNEETYDVYYSIREKAQVIAIDDIARISIYEAYDYDRREYDRREEILKEFNEYRAMEHAKQMAACLNRGLLTQAEVDVYPAPLVCTLEV